MTDRELLELAAKAAGYVIQWGDAWGRDGFDYARINGMMWHPLTDDGDALRLAVKLQIYVQPDGRHAWATTLQVDTIEEVGDDPCAATRRAIVRAAAEIGKGGA